MQVANSEKPISAIINMENTDNNGTESEDIGRDSLTNCKNMVKASSTVIVIPILSPLEAGKKKLKRITNSRITHGTMTLNT